MTRQGKPEGMKLPFLVRFILTTMLHVYMFCKLIFRGRPSRNIHQIISVICNESKRESLPCSRQQPVHGRVELDPDADTTVLGLNFMVLAYTGKESEVLPYADKYDAIRNVPVVTGATVWTNSQDSAPILLDFNEALWMGDQLHHTLINPNQLRSYGVDVQDSPFAKEDLAITTANYIIPFDTQGTTIFCDTRSPTEVELQQLPRVILTSAIDRDPQKVQFPSHHSDRVVSNICAQRTCDPCLHKTTYDPEHFFSGLSNKFMLTGQMGNRTQPYNKAILPQGLSSPENIIRG